MSTCGVALPYYCGKTSCDTNVPTGTNADVFCNAAQPTTVYDQELDKDVPIANCRRQPHAEGSHAAFTFAVSEPEEWS